MKKRIGFYLFFIGFFAAIFSLVLTSSALFKHREDKLRKDLKALTHNLSQRYDSSKALPDKNDPLFLQLRMTFISPEGKVLVDTDINERDMTHHGDRTEILNAIKSGEGESFRKSETLRTKVYYYALKNKDNSIIRLSIREESVWGLYPGMIIYLLPLVIAIFLISVLIAFILTRRFLKPIERIAENVEENVPLNKEVVRYSELLPFLTKIRKQNRRIQKHIRNLNLEHERLSVLIQNIAEGFFLLDSRKHISLINDEAKRILSITEDRPGENIFHYTRHPAFFHSIQQGLRGEKALDELEIQGKYFQLIVSPVTESGEISGVLCLLIDNTEKHRLEQMKIEFTANVSHELKTPLTVISGYAEIIENNMADKEDLPLFASRIRRECARLIRLSEDIIKLSELDESSGFLLESENVNLRQVAEEVKMLLLPSAEKKGVRFRIESPDTVVRGNYLMIHEMIYNLTDNAIRYNKENGEVVILVGNGGITVRDSGIGIPEENRSRIFERFYRVDKSRSKETGGTGLGLAIVKHIAEKHHAKITLKSELGSGTEINVRFM
ncbi:MAG: hypothetical protein LBR60_06070 [Fibrobacter sp.]|jgi:two-component system phosphate regulon sensor histidine kinase PhoR|nr:hypothetical protein [Fibrobacter sp.]